MAVVYGILGLVVILTAGTFGTINSSPWFNLGIAALFVVLGLAMFDVLLIDFSKYSTTFSSGSRRGSVALAFSMGAVAALLAGACVAPVVIQVVLFSSNLYATGTHDRARAAVLPRRRHGDSRGRSPARASPRCRSRAMWMVRVKQAFGVFILATAAYYGYEGYSILSRTAGSIRRPVSVERRGAGEGRLALRRSPKASQSRSVRTSRCSSTCGPRGARTA